MKAFKVTVTLIVSLTDSSSESLLGAAKERSAFHYNHCLCVVVRSSILFHLPAQQYLEQISSLFHL